MHRLLLLCLCCPLLGFSGCPNDLNEALRMYGHSPVCPASTFYQPGTLVYVINQNPLQLGTVCSAEEVMGKDYRPMQSPTQSADLTRATRKAINFNAEFLDSISGNANFHHIKSIKTSLRNARLFEVTDSDVDKRVGEISESCRRHVRWRQAARQPITMIASALQADMVYTVHFDKSAALDSAARLAQLQDVAAELKLSATGYSSRTIEAKGLYWGIRDDVYLASLFFPTAYQRAQGRDRNQRDSRLIDPELERFVPGRQGDDYRPWPFDNLRRPSQFDEYRRPSQANEWRGPSQFDGPPARRPRGFAPVEIDAEEAEEEDDTEAPVPSNGQSDGLTVHQMSHGRHAHPLQSEESLRRPSALRGPRFAADAAPDGATDAMVPPSAADDAQGIDESGDAGDGGATSAAQEPDATAEPSPEDPPADPSAAAVPDPGPDAAPAADGAAATTDVDEDGSAATQAPAAPPSPEPDAPPPQPTRRKAGRRGAPPKKAERRNSIG